MINSKKSQASRPRKIALKLLVLCSLIGAGWWAWPDSRKVTAKSQPASAKALSRREHEPVSREPEPRAEERAPGEVVGGRGAEPPHAEFAADAEREVETGEPGLKRFVDAAGRTVRELRIDEAGRPLVDTRFADDQERSTRRTYDLAGTVLREEVRLNGQVVEERTFR